MPRKVTNGKKALWVISAALLLAAVLFMLWQVEYGRLANTSSVVKIDLLKEGWDYMPGVVVTSDGLHITSLQRAIVKQDGTLGQLNPSVNLYGAHLSAAKDFTLTATLADIKGGASLRLYESAPVIQDEFRIEPKSIDIAVQGKTLTLSSWAGYASQGIYDQSPTSVRSYPIAENASELVIARRDGRMSVAVNGHSVAQMTAAESIDSSTVWFGLSAAQPVDSWTLKELKVSSDDPRSIALVNTQKTTIHRDSGAQKLQVLARHQRPNFLIGAAMALGPTVADAQYRQVAFGGDFGSMTSENALKWQFIHPQPGVYDFKEADALVAIAKKNNLTVHGHTLVFGEANPAWVQDQPTTTNEDKAAIERVMLDHIHQTVGHFKGRIGSWDVVNEPLADDDNSPVGLREHIWYDAMGEAYIAKAFTAAHTADPSAKLYINDFGLEADGERWNAMYDLVARLKKSNVPIDGVGFEAHVYQPGDEIEDTTLRSHIRALAALGVTSRISEMDVYNDGDADAQADQYAAVLGICLSEPSCVSWTTWGVSDRYDSSLDDAGQVVYGQDFIWDKDFRPTPAVDALQKVMLR
jgi:endo-1,4-beta-xylanase